MASPLLAALRSPLRPTVPAPSGPTAPSRAQSSPPRDPGRARWCLLALPAGTAAAVAAVDDLTAPAVAP